MGWSTFSTRPQPRHGSDAPIAGPRSVIAGSGNAKLKVSFFGPFYIGDYWVLDHDPDYQWSIVGEPRGRFLGCCIAGAGRRSDC